MKPLRVILLSSFIISLLSVLSCTRKEQESEPIIRPVRYQQVYVTGGTRVRTFSGTAQAGAETNLSFKVPGTIKRVPVKVGDAVRRGQLIAELDPQDYRLQVQEAEAALEQSMAQARNASANYERVRDAYENRTASKSDLDAARAASESAEAAVRSVEKRLELANLQVDYTRLTAPDAGSIAAVNVEVNENVSAGMPVVVLTSGERPEVKVTIPEVMIAQVKAGSHATVTFDAIRDHEFDATVTEVGVASTGFETAFPVIVRFNEATDEVRPGMAAEVSFQFETSDARERIIVPAVSVAEDQMGRFVFVVEPTGEGLGLVRRKEVTVGELTSDGLEILKGVQDGDLVVTAGVTRLVDGQKVKLL